MLNLKNIKAYNNGRDGVRIEGGMPVHIDGLETGNNGGQGLNIVGNEPEPVSKSAEIKTGAPPRKYFPGWVPALAIATAAAVVGGGLLHLFGWQ